VILAHLPGHQINKLFLTHQKAIALAKLGTDLDAFKQALKQIREDGFAKTTAEFSPGITGIASPVFNREGKILGSIGIGVQATKLRWNIAPVLIESVRQAAQEVNTALSSI